MEKDLQSDTSGYFGRLMVALCANGREPSEGWDMSEAEESAQKLYEVTKHCAYVIHSLMERAIYFSNEVIFIYVQMQFDLTI